MPVPTQEGPAAAPPKGPAVKIIDPEVTGEEHAVLTSAPMVPPPPPPADHPYLPQVWVLELSSFQLHYSEDFAPTVATVLKGRGALQDMVHTEFVKPLTRYARTVRDPNLVLQELDEAVSRALGFGSEPGPAYLDFPIDTLRAGVSKAVQLSEFFQLADDSEAGWEHTVSWLDCTAGRRTRGRQDRGGPLPERGDLLLGDGDDLVDQRGVHVGGRLGRHQLFASMPLSSAPLWILSGPGTVSFTPR